MKSALQFEGVSFSRGGHAVLRGVDLTLGQGEVLGLLGPNGAGKTSLLRLATRVLRADTGSVRIGDAPVESLSRRELAQRVAIVPQESQIPFPFKVLEVVLMGRAPHLGGPLGFESKADVELALQCMERVGVAEFAERSILSLSGGERQLVMVARALAQTAQSLLMDEPTAFLDLRHRSRVLELAREFASQDGRSALVVSHDLSLAARYCDRLALLESGQILALGTPTEVLTPDVVQRTFGLSVEILSASDGSPVVIPSR